jgi:hypothetical protein
MQCRVKNRLCPLCLQIHGADGDRLVGDQKSNAFSARVKTGALKASELQMDHPKDLIKLFEKS